MSDTKPIKPIKWKQMDYVGDETYFVSDMYFDTIFSKYKFVINLIVSFDKKAHQVYSYSIRGCRFTQTDSISYKTQLSLPVVKSKKATSYNKCVAEIFENILDIMIKDSRSIFSQYEKYGRELDKLVLVKDKLHDLQKFYESNQTIKAPTCKK